MSEILTHRRGFITGLISFVAAPAIVRAGSLMQVKQMIDPFDAEHMMRALLDRAQRQINPPWGCDGMQFISLEQMKLTWDRLAQFAVIPAQ